MQDRNPDDISLDKVSQILAACADSEESGSELSPSNSRKIASLDAEIQRLLEGDTSSSEGWQSDSSEASLTSVHIEHESTTMKTTPSDEGRSTALHILYGSEGVNSASSQTSVLSSEDNPVISVAPLSIRSGTLRTDSDIIIDVRGESSTSSTGDSSEEVDSIPKPLAEELEETQKSHSAQKLRRSGVIDQPDISTPTTDKNVQLTLDMLAATDSEISVTSSDSIEDNPSREVIPHSTTQEEELILDMVAMTVSVAASKTKEESSMAATSCPEGPPDKEFTLEMLAMSGSETTLVTSESEDESSVAATSHPETHAGLPTKPDKGFTLEMLAMSGSETSLVTSESEDESSVAATSRPEEHAWSPTKPDKEFTLEMLAMSGSETTLVTSESEDESSVAAATSRPETHAGSPTKPDKEFTLEMLAMSGSETSLVTSESEEESSVAAATSRPEEHAGLPTKPDKEFTLEMLAMSGSETSLVTSESEEESSVAAATSRPEEHAGLPTKPDKEFTLEMLAMSGSETSLVTSEREDESSDSTLQKALTKNGCNRDSLSMTERLEVMLAQLRTTGVVFDSPPQAHQSDEEAGVTEIDSIVLSEGEGSATEAACPEVVKILRKESEQELLSSGIPILTPELEGADDVHNGKPLSPSLRNTEDHGKANGLHNGKPLSPSLRNTEDHKANGLHNGKPLSPSLRNTEDHGKANGLQNGKPLSPSLRDTEDDKANGLQNGKPLSPSLRNTEDSKANGLHKGKPLSPSLRDTEDDKANGLQNGKPLSPSLRDTEDDKANGLHNGKPLSPSLRNPEDVKTNGLHNGKPLSPSLRNPEDDKTNGLHNGKPLSPSLRNTEDDKTNGLHNGKPLSPSLRNTENDKDIQEAAGSQSTPLKGRMTVDFLLTTDSESTPSSGDSTPVEREVYLKHSQRIISPPVEMVEPNEPSAAVSGSISTTGGSVENTTAEIDGNMAHQHQLRTLCQNPEELISKVSIQLLLCS